MKSCRTMTLESHLLETFLFCTRKGRKHCVGMVNRCCDAKCRNVCVKRQKLSSRNRKSESRTQSERDKNGQYMYITCYESGVMSNLIKSGISPCKQWNNAGNKRASSCKVITTQAVKWYSQTNSDLLLITKYACVCAKCLYAGSISSVSCFQ